MASLWPLAAGLFWFGLWTPDSSAAAQQQREAATAGWTASTKGGALRRRRTRVCLVLLAVQKCVALLRVTCWLSIQKGSGSAQRAARSTAAKGSVAACNAATPQSSHVPGTNPSATTQVHHASRHLPLGAHVPRARVNHDEVQPAVTPLGLHCLVVTGHGWPICISAIIDWPWRSHNAGPRPPFEGAPGHGRLASPSSTARALPSRPAGALSQRNARPLRARRAVRPPYSNPCYFRMLLLDWRRSIFALTRPHS
ncbi:hypothetical protein MAC_00906 [Metarhizium acridum CQMa 102]|uniref:Secreted protein n=1 Tax=Metarhizium acridum (strain CQMa 102) TaxID=655827 RepID=E9DT24_METAQ|nr:uncharacterized protein MAC_00906 [Metarhizium acridum CQMa 102]EFY93123.1 hypothetical protein MAC_00906 [Metarhizium acridum CQMa 102]